VCRRRVCRIRASRRLCASRLADSIASVSSVVAITPLDIPCKGHPLHTHPLASLHPASIPQMVAHYAIHTLWGQTVGERNARQARIACCINGARACLARTLSRPPMHWAIRKPQAKVTLVYPDWRLTCHLCATYSIDLHPWSWLRFGYQAMDTFNVLLRYFTAAI
jgi:hypothetical protein